MFPLSDSVRARTFPIVNILLIAATIAVFYKQLASADPDVFIETYAVIPSLVNFGNSATLVPFLTAIFLHGGLLHILSNLWFLWIFGDNVEGYFGHAIYLFFYLFSGIIGNMIQYLLMPTSGIPMLGASGAIAGVLGAYFVLFPLAKVKSIIPIFFFVTIYDIPAPLMLGFWFILQLISGASSLPFSSETGGIAFFAHIGGFLTGAILARIFMRTSSPTLPSTKN